MNITKLYYSTKEAVEIVNEKMSKIKISDDEFLLNINVDALRWHCKRPDCFKNVEIEHIKKGNRYLITNNGLEQLIKYHTTPHKHYSPFDNLDIEKPKQRKKYKIKRIK